MSFNKSTKMTEKRKLPINDFLGRKTWRVIRIKMQGEKKETKKKISGKEERMNKREKKKKSMKYKTIVKGGKTKKII